MLQKPSGFTLLIDYPRTQIRPAWNRLFRPVPFIQIDIMTTKTKLV